MIVDCAVYEQGRRRPGTLAVEHAFDFCGLDGAFVWLGLYEPTEEEFDAVRREFGLHELAVEDAIHAHQRPKLESYDDSLFAVLKPAHYLEQERTIEFGEVLVFIGAGFIITVRHGEAALHEARLHAEARADLLRSGPGAALYAIVDRIVDDYQPVVAALDREIEDVEREVFSPDPRNTAEQIYDLKREVLALHAAVAPLAEPLDRLARGRLRFIDDDIHAYFRDAHDHLLRILGQVESCRDLLTSVLAANMTQVTVRQNEDVRKISSWAAIVAVPTLITSIYGMNFRHMPELTWRFGYPLAIAGILAVCAALYAYFRRIGWL